MFLESAAAFDSALAPPFFAPAILRSQAGKFHFCQLDPTNKKLLPIKATGKLVLHGGCPFVQRKSVQSPPTLADLRSSLAAAVLLAPQKWRPEEEAPELALLRAQGVSRCRVASSRTCGPAEWSEQTVCRARARAWRPQAGFWRRLDAPTPRRAERRSCSSQAGSLEPLEPLKGASWPRSASTSLLGLDLDDGSQINSSNDELLASLALGRMIDSRPPLLGQLLRPLSN